MGDFAVHVLNLDGNIVSLISLLLSVVGQIGGISLMQQLNEPVSEVTATDRNLCNEVRNSVTFVNGHSVSDTLASIEHGTSCATSSKE